MQALLDWLDHRIDYRRHLQALRFRVLPEGPSWWQTSASCLMWLLVLECVSGLLLMTTYSPSMASAWASVNFIDQSSAGRFLRGLHHYSSHAIIILFGVHLVRVLMMRAYQAPRELVWITGLLMFPLIIVWTVTGNPLSASQKGIAQIQVEGNILAATPLIGASLQHLLFGGHDVGNLTLTRLYFLHVGLLPLLVGALCLVHLQQVLKHSACWQNVVSDLSDLPRTLPYWPHQTFRNLTVLSLIVGILSWISWQSGAPLSAPADPELPFSPRPEWYFRWLFELRRHFTGNTEFIATLLVPATFLCLLLLVPFLDRLLPVRADRLCRLLIVAACAGGWGWLTYSSFNRDWHDKEYVASQMEFQRWSDRARELARTEPMPQSGAVDLLRHDYVTQGPRLFARHCGGCHSATDSHGTGIAVTEPTAPNLYGIGTARWIGGFLSVERIASPDYFANTAFRDGEMKQHIQSLFEEYEPAVMVKNLHAVAIALSAESGHEPRDSVEAEQGRKLLTGDLRCVDCHKFGEAGSAGSAPDLTGYASESWLRQIISNPRDVRFYGERNDRMPSFAVELAHPELNLLTDLEVDLLAKWLLNSSGNLQNDTAPGVGTHKSPAPIQPTSAIAIKGESDATP